MDIDLSTSLVGWITLIIYNVAIIRILMTSLSRVALKEALREKDPASNAAALSTAAVKQAAGDPAPVDNTSYSRVAGMIGATVLACFLWALGNMIILKIFTGKIDDIAKIMSSGVGTYFLAGASLFAPYGVNQLKAAFKG